jgi:hypothetical protein
MAAAHAAAEQQRLAAAREHGLPWRRQAPAPHLSERQWGTVREGYRASGDAWSCCSQPRQVASRAYHWGEDGLPGFVDDRQPALLCLALWNGRRPDPEGAALRLTNAEGNHGGVPGGSPGLHVAPMHHVEVAPGLSGRPAAHSTGCRQSARSPLPGPPSAHDLVAVGSIAG